MNNEQRQKLYELNLRAWDGEVVYPLVSQKLDTSIKKNTGFIKKLKKGLTKENKSSLLKDIGEISLEKYLSEVITTINEVTSNISNKNEDILTAVEIICAMHQRFNVRFTIPFFELFLSNFANPTEQLSEKDENFRISKLKSNLKIITELYLVHVFKSIDIVESKDMIPYYLQRKIHRKEPFIFSILKEMLNYKFKMGYTLSVGTLFVKNFSPFFDNDDTSWDLYIMDDNFKDLLHSLFKAFSEAVITRMTDLTKTVTKLMKEHKKCQIRTGKLNDEYIEEYDLLIPILEKFKTATEVFAPIFNLETPELVSQNVEDEDDKPLESMIVTQVIPVSERVWESEDMRIFYEVLPNLDHIVKHFENTESSTGSDTTILNTFFEDLKLVETKEEMDNLSESYWKKSLDNKATRNRLLKFFIETQDWSKINIYARFLASNAKYMPEVSEEFIKYLDNGFRHQLHTNKINVKNIIFFCHMIKFKLVPTFMIFHKIRTLIINLQVPNNIEILTIFFEYSGKFLLNHPEFKPHMETMVELLKTKMKEKKLTMNFKGALDNILSLLYPPTVKSLNEVESKETSQQLFYRVLIRRELVHFDEKQVLILVREADWNDKCIYQTLFSLFSKPEKISYQNIPILTKVLSGLYVYHRNFVIEVIDQVLENIDEGLEVDDFSENLRRVAQVRYLTEIFNMEMVKSNVISDVIYQIIRYGHFHNTPSPKYFNQSDLPNNYFRIQLISTILLNIERFPRIFTKELVKLLRFFEYYIFTKSQPLPMGTRFKVEDVFTEYSKKLKFDRAESLIESATIFQSLIQSTAISTVTTHNKSDIRGNVTPKTLSNVKSSLKESEEEDDEDDDEDDDDNDEGLYYEDGTEEDDDTDERRTSRDGTNPPFYLDDENDDLSAGSTSDSDDDSSSDDSSDSDFESDEDSDSSSDEEDFDDIEADRNAEVRRIYNEYETRLQSEEECKAQEELEKQFEQLMADSMDERKSEKSASSNMPMISSMNQTERSKTKLLKKPIIKTKQPTGKENEKVAFTFLSKAGKKTSSRVLELPVNVKFVSGVLEEEEKIKTEREKIKKIVLQQSFD
ncbi:similar to Saccharomyces cerevisiae YHR077C NMD2 Protein involved in the nonsense-mediated mRNA decay (NMD) pathway [Maudiozyma barnettii]|uniref:Similar to Saccharomyces cerevisiae YHR077C NMD2 Protein involved in the nonsense-mediated mRNA decay (NMD) pathway n=1 Tax=Maudiozyma barnettii TaxID=61262 RepID=A0A8H2VBR8_9SACH|nr:Nmd2p [Kazachstania barnettii]CAB4252346.1 similar to Saccharomyces cerevisiae YHR077C NMD2 Protein involved in the nonsense-mediated mRNA decay (NMD) pathway [Kazachstania barnettii]CAD1779080.1 similar to Saccharomyces cerevisiae YHR077C NMD2 Protein involved in the nonsense-mediated mRNA decay (NMD) pathway [Kazachstania barnettii]